MALKYTVTLYGLRGGRRAISGDLSTVDSRVKLRILNFLSNRKISPKKGRFAYDSEEIQQAIGAGGMDTTDFEVMLYEMEQDDLLQPISSSEVPDQLIDRGQETMKDPTGYQYVKERRKDLVVDEDGKLKWDDVQEVPEAAARAMPAVRTSPEGVPLIDRSGPGIGPFRMRPVDPKN